MSSLKISLFYICTIAALLLVSPEAFSQSNANTASVVPTGMWHEAPTIAAASDVSLALVSADVEEGSIHIEVATPSVSYGEGQTNTPLNAPSTRQTAALILPSPSLLAPVERAPSPEQAESQCLFIVRLGERGMRT